MNRTTMLTIGTLLYFEGEPLTVTGFDGPSTRLTTSSGRTKVILTTELLLKARTVESPSDGDESLEAALTDALPEHVLNPAKLKRAHLQEAMTGFRSGDVNLAGEGEPRPLFDPRLTNKSQRMAAKAQELGKSEATLWEWQAAFREHGLLGLVDKRYRKLQDPLRSVDSRVRDELAVLINENTGGSNISKNRYRVLTRHRVEDKWGTGEVVFPGKTLFNQMFNELSKGRGTTGAAKQRRSIANRPKGTYTTFRTEAHRAGQYVLIDSTPLDVFAMDSLTFEWMKVELTIAVDLFTGSILAWRFTSGATRKEEATLLLSDMLRPRPMRADWPAHAAWRYHGVPENLVVSLAQGFKAAGIPIVRPETVVIDHGKVFLSDTFAAACQTLGISVQYARPLTPTDKAYVERLFRTIRESFLENLPGYKGPDVWSRGEDVEDEAFYFLHEIDERFTKWVATMYQVRYHRGLHLEGSPYQHLSPNDMYDMSIAKNGFLYTPVSPTLYLELLPIEWRTIQAYGVDINNLKYNGDGLNGRRLTTSPFQGRHEGMWPIRYDRRDASKVWFQDPDDKTWHILGWTGSSKTQRQFSEIELSFAKRRVIERHGNPSNEAEIEAELSRMVRDIAEDQKMSKQERRQLIRSLEQSQAVAKDQAEATTVAGPADPLGDGAYLGPDPASALTWAAPSDIPLLASEDDLEADFDDTETDFDDTEEGTFDE
jgi:transposase InsO family protein